jgi:hypothetical protein
MINLMAEQPHDHTEPHPEASPLQGYFDWQVNTLMLARDLTDPIEPGDDSAHQQRRAETEDHVRRLSLAVIPAVYQNDPELPWPPAVMMAITRATIAEAAKLAGLMG